MNLQSLPAEVTDTTPVGVGGCPLEGRGQDPRDLRGS